MNLLKGNKMSFFIPKTNLLVQKQEKVINHKIVDLYYIPTPMLEINDYYEKTFVYICLYKDEKSILLKKIIIEEEFLSVKKFTHH